ncbi:hypothetical protein B9Z55_005124 [Caenorhabditis nigoni]|uniref:BTB domain-containing protein n=1 Tax=Caenorhabditis nigoni TaxID=1611254 RepID=A0A2G5UZH0_9PELO|nr:hypothetical protein B9Z55_005124 [Caenorhabditis nigoni]
MSPTADKNFVIKRVFENLNKLGSSGTIIGNPETNFRALWTINVFKYGDGDLRFDLTCLHEKANDWSITVVFDVLIGGKPFKTNHLFTFNQYNNSTFLPYLRRHEFSNYLISSTVTIEFQVKISEITVIDGRKLQESNSRYFDNDVAKESSDVVLLVGDQKFYVSKLLLTFHSTYFKSLFFGNFSESKKLEIELKDTDPEVFQQFLELIYGISAVDDTMIMEILKLADFFNAQMLMKRCEEFLLDRSHQPLKLKFQAALKYKMEKLKVKCYSEMEKSTDFRDFSPRNAQHYSQEDWKELFDKVVDIYRSS